jgi:diaminopimelate decarboxylase
MPKLDVGDLIAVPASGAYQLSMSSNYNGSLKPAVLWLETGQARLIQRRETIEDLVKRDQVLP